MATGPPGTLSAESSRLSEAEAAELLQESREEQNDIQKRSRWDSWLLDGQDDGPLEGDSWKVTLTMVSRI
jgi:hypothetical protein